jgi:outer membrane protein assembly factor BamB
MFVRLLTLAAICSLAGSAGAADWPHYRGPAQDGRSSETIAKAWPASGPKVLWRQPLGQGFSGISVVAGKAYTLYGAGADELVLALDATSGKTLWKTRLDANRADDMGGGPRSTPTVAGDRVYVLGAKGKLAALEAAGGKILWSVDLVATYGARIPQWGVSVSPVVEGDLLLVDVGGKENHSVMGFEKATGKMRWASQTGEPGYSVPLVTELAGTRQALFFTGSGLVAVDPASGKFFWRVPWKTDYNVNAAMPVIVPPDKVFISSAYDTGAGFYQITKDGSGWKTAEIWKSRGMQNHFNSSVLIDGHLYGFDRSRLKCIRVADGQERWNQSGFNRGSLLYVDGHLLVLGERGELALVKANPDSYQEIGKTKVFPDGDKTWTMPTLAGGRLYVRSEAQLVALDLQNP